MTNLGDLVGYPKIIHDCLELVAKGTYLVLVHHDVLAL